jgi:hypothetical protein
MTGALRGKCQTLSICLMSSWTEGFQWNSTKKTFSDGGNKIGNRDKIAAEIGKMATWQEFITW